MSYDGRVQVWIRKEDKEAWDAIADKGEWLHKHLDQERVEQQVKQGFGKLSDLGESKEFELVDGREFIKPADDPKYEPNYERFEEAA